ncbi:MAG: ATP-binding protein [Lachnospiraceae bacterium]|nr:ATP-binding protein [Lachnospiraceae bacterium]
MIRRSIRRNGLETAEGKAEIDLWTKELLELLERTDTLLFFQNELEVEADLDNLGILQSFIEEKLENADCPLPASLQIQVAAEEIFVNIANYAYAPEKGKASVRVEISEKPVTVTLTFIDHGIPFDPLAQEDPDITLPASERKIGGLGIFMTKKTMDDVAYEYKNGRNILTLKKILD